MHRFRLMSLYVVIVVAALGCAIVGIAALRIAEPPPGLSDAP